MRTIRQFPRGSSRRSIRPISRSPSSGRAEHPLRHSCASYIVSRRRSSSYLAADRGARCDRRGPVQFLSVAVQKVCPIVFFRCWKTGVQCFPKNGPLWLRAAALRLIGRRGKRCISTQTIAAIMAVLTALSARLSVAWYTRYTNACSAQTIASF